MLLLASCSALYLKDFWRGWFCGRRRGRFSRWRPLTLPPPLFLARRGERRIARPSKPTIHPSTLLPFLLHTLHTSYSFLPVLYICIINTINRIPSSTYQRYCWLHSIHIRAYKTDGGQKQS